MKKSRLIALLNALEGDPEIRVREDEKLGGGYPYAARLRQWNNVPTRCAYLVTDKQSRTDFPRSGCPIVRVRVKRAKKVSDAS